MTIDQSYPQVWDKGSFAFLGGSWSELPTQEVSLSLQWLSTLADKPLSFPYSTTMVNSKRSPGRNQRLVRCNILIEALVSLIWGFYILWRHLELMYQSFPGVWWWMAQTSLWCIPWQGCVVCQLSACWRGAPSVGGLKDRPQWGHHDCQGSWQSENPSNWPSMDGDGMRSWQCVQRNMWWASSQGTQK